MTRRHIDAKKPPLLWSDVAKAFDDINQNFIEFEALVGGPGVDFNSLSTSVSPSITEFYDLGSNSKRWRDLYLSGSSLYLGDAVITATGSTINLPAGVTIGGNIVDSEYFREIAVSGQTNIVADVGGSAVLNLASGDSGITITTNPATDTVTFSNSGVRQLTGTAGQIGVSASTGNITLTNLGVTSIVAGFGISVNQSTGAVTVTNDGLAGIDAGLGITVSARDPVTGRVTVTNNQPNIPQNTFLTVAVPTQSSIIASTTTSTLTVARTGDGLAITTTPITNTITLQNTGVTSLAVGNGLTASSGTGSINLTLNSTLNRNIIGDVKGSVFGDDSSILVDATGSFIYGNVSATTLRTAETKIALGNNAGLTNQGTNAVAIGSNAGTTNQPANSIVINASGVVLNGSAAGFYVDPIRLTTSSARPVVYNTTTKELFYTSTLEFINSTISTTDSSGLTVDVQTTFNTDVAIQNDLSVTQRLIVAGSRVINLSELKSVVAASTSFADFQSRIAALN